MLHLEGVLLVCSKINDTNCVWSETGKELTFNEVDDAELSTIDKFSSSDQHENLRKNGKQYMVRQKI